MTRVVFFTVTASLLMHFSPARAQGFRVQLAAFDKPQPPAYFEERGVDNYTEAPDKSGIYWYSAGSFSTLEEAEVVYKDLVSKGFPYAILIDEEEQRLLKGIDCPYVRDGVVYMQEPTPDPSTHIIYFDFGMSSLTVNAKGVLDEVYHKMKQTPGYTLKIKGFTDGVGDAMANMELASIRSRSARDYLIYKGVRADKMFMEVFGEAEPAAPNAEDDGSNAGKGRDLPENRKWNRRVTLSLEETAKTTPATNSPK